MSDKAKQVLDMIIQTSFLAKDMRRVIKDASALLMLSLEEEQQIADEIINFLKENNK
jgi:uncharacterized protein (UPF0147 family)